MITLVLAAAINLAPPSAHDPKFNMARPTAPMSKEKETDKVSLGVKSSIPEQIAVQQVEKIDATKPYTNVQTLPDVKGTVKNSTNSVNLKLKF